MAEVGYLRPVQCKLGYQPLRELFRLRTHRTLDPAASKAKRWENGKIRDRKPNSPGDLLLQPCGLYKSPKKEKAKKRRDATTKVSKLETPTSFINSNEHHGD